MAKKEEKNEKKNIVNNNLNDENIQETIEQENKVGKMFEKAIAELNDEKDQKKKEILKDAAVMAEYTIKRKVLELRRQREEGKVLKEVVKSIGEAIEELASDKITPQQWTDKLAKIAEEENKGFNEAAQKHKSLVKELRDNYPNKYSAEWEYDSWNRGGRRPSWY